MNKATVTRCVAALVSLGFGVDVFSGPENSGNKLILPHTIQEHVTSEQVVTIVPNATRTDPSAQLQWSKGQDSPPLWRNLSEQPSSGAFVDRPLDPYRFYRVQQSGSNPPKLRIAATSPNYRTNHTLTFPSLSGWTYQLLVQAGPS